LLTRALEMNPQRRNCRGWQRHVTILISLPPTHKNLPPIEVEVLHSKRQTFRHAQPTSIHENRTKSRNILHHHQQAPHFRLRQHSRQSRGSASRRNVGHESDRHGKNVPVQKENRMQSLILRGSTHILLGREMSQECRNLRLPHRRRMSPLMKDHEPAYPTAVRSLGLRAVMPSAQAMAKPLHQTELLFRLRFVAEMR